MTPREAVNNKTIKNLEGKNKLIFDTLNVQQNTIDNLIDELSKNKKENKKLQEKFSNVQGANKSLQEQVKQLSEVTNQIDALRESNTHLVNKLGDMRHEIELLKEKSCECHKMAPNRPTTTDQAEIPSQNVIMLALCEMRQENAQQFAHLHDLIMENQARPRSSNQQINLTPNEEKNEFSCIPKVSSNYIVPTGKTRSTEAATNTPTNTPKMSKNDTTSHKSEGNEGSENVPKTSTVGEHTSEKIECHRTSYRRDRQGAAMREERPGKKQDGGWQQPKHKISSRNRRDTSNSLKAHENRARKPRTTETKYQTRKCLVIHDDYLDEFDSSKFSQWYDVTLMGYKTLRDALEDNSLTKKINTLNPAVIFIHLGQSDILRKTPGNDVVLDMKKLLESLEFVTKAKICVSLLIPLIGLPSTNSIIKQVNREISRNISELRRRTQSEQKHFTQNNDRLSGFILRSTGKHGATYSLNGRGQRKLWLQLRDGLDRAINSEASAGNKNQATAGTSNPTPPHNPESKRNISHYE